MFRALAFASRISGASGMTWVVTLSFSQAVVYAFCRSRNQWKGSITIFITNKTISILRPYTTHLKILHLVHDLVVGTSQSQVHGVHQFAKLEIWWMSAVLIFTLNLTANLGSFNGKRANRDPSSAFDKVIPVRFVIILEKKVMTQISSKVKINDLL